MLHFNKILFVIVLLCLNVKSEIVLPQTPNSGFWYNNKIYCGWLLKKTKTYKVLHDKHYWRYFSKGTSNSFGYYFTYKDYGDDITLWSSRLDSDNNTINIISSNKFTVFSQNWFKGLNLRFSVLSQKNMCTWYEDKTNIYPVFCGVADKIIYFPNFRGGFNWQVACNNPFIVKLTLDRETQKVTSHKVIELPYSLKDFYKDATYSVKEWYCDAIYLPTPAPLSCTNYMLVTKTKGFEVRPDLEFILVGILDNGKIFARNTAFKLSKTNFDLDFVHLNWFSNNTYFLSHRFGKVDIFNNKKIIKTGELSFINVNAELPNHFKKDSICFHKKDIVLSGSINGIATVVTLKYTKDKVIRKIQNFPKVNFGEYDHLMAIQRPNHYVDIVFSKNQIDENIERDLPIIHTINLN